MRNKTLLFEGYDGSGKTTLINNLTDHLTKSGNESLVIGRDYNKVITNITFAIKDKDTDLTPDAEILLRFGRELERIKILNDNVNKYAYSILDRSIISAISWITYYGRPFELYSSLASLIADQVGGCELIYCHIPFERAWTRTTTRGSLSKKELRGKEINNKMYDALLHTYRNITFDTMNKTEIDMDQTREECLGDLLKHLHLK